MGAKMQLGETETRQFQTVMSQLWGMTEEEKATAIVAIKFFMAGYEAGKEDANGSGRDRANNSGS